MDADYTLSLSQIAQQLNRERVDIAESTVRKYAKLYREFLPSRKLEGVRWERYPTYAHDVIKRIFELSESGKSRHEIKHVLKADGHGVTLDGESAEVTDTANEPAQPYDNTPLSLQPQHDDTLLMLQRQQGNLIDAHNARLAKSALDSLEWYRGLLEEKDLQITELEQLAERLKAEKQEIVEKETRMKEEYRDVLEALQKRQYRKVGA